MPRSLAAAVRHSVTTNTRDRGLSYFFNGRVTIDRTAADRVSATVRGSHPYNVSIRIDGNRLAVDCNCPRFLDTLQPCKHVWAVILAADSRRLLTPPPGLF